ncbi:MAG: hypothetical protein K2N73_04760 [Lachnospiraceae bacterium]|nr:hypothetical protein [Lachnospiraceae bacterium]
MKFKYMIRGLGLGVIMTAAVMGAYNRQAVADARVAVLKEYGIGEESVLVDETEPSEEDAETAVPEGTTQPVIVRNEEKESEIQSVLDEARDTERSDMTENPAESVAPGDEATGTQPAEEGAEQESSSGTVIVAPDGEGEVSEDSIQITISKGDDSGTISRKLYNAGLIENADEYDAFLMQHGYDKKLSTGTKNISATDSWQEIAEKLTRK